jgi:hypothetical protein
MGVCYRKVAGPGALIAYAIPVLSEGDTVAVRVRPPAKRALEDGVGTYLTRTASRY